jgi:uncharacterized protein YecE (DUF72 family)
MDILGPKLGPIVFQFPFFSRSIFSDRHAFTDKLVPILKKLPADHKIGIEIRYCDWLNAEFADLEHSWVAAAGFLIFDLRRRGPVLRYS